MGELPNSNDARRRATVVTPAGTGTLLYVAGPKSPTRRCKVEFRGQTSGEPWRRSFPLEAVTIIEGECCDRP